MEFVNLKKKPWSLFTKNQEFLATSTEFVFIVVIIIITKISTSMINIKKFHPTGRDNVTDDEKITMFQTYNVVLILSIVYIHIQGGCLLQCGDIMNATSNYLINTCPCFVKIVNSSW